MGLKHEAPGGSIWDETRIRLRDEILAAVSAQLSAGRSGAVVARHLDKAVRLLRVGECHRDQEYSGSNEEIAEVQAEELAELVQPEIEAFRRLTNNARPPSKLLNLAHTRLWLASYIAQFRRQHPHATAREWRALLEPVWRQALDQYRPLEEAAIDEVRDARSANAAALRFLCNAYPDHGTPEDLGKRLDHVKFNGKKLVKRNPDA